VSHFAEIGKERNDAFSPQADTHLGGSTGALHRARIPTATLRNYPGLFLAENEWPAYNIELQGELTARCLVASPPPYARLAYDIAIPSWWPSLSGNLDGACTERSPASLRGRVDRAVRL
jgi:hypothetical protein